MLELYQYFIGNDLTFAAEDYEAGVTEFSIVGDLPIGQEITFETHTLTYFIIDKTGTIVTINKPTGSSIKKGQRIQKRYTFDQILQNISLEQSAVILRIHPYPEDLIQSLNLQDSIVVYKVVSKTISQSFTLTDELTRQFIIGAGYSDNLVLTQNLSENSVFSRILSSNLSLNDQISDYIVYVRQFTDNISLSESLILHFSSLEVVSQSITLNDSINRNIIYNISRIDTLTLITDQSNQLLHDAHSFYNLSNNDILTLNENLIPHYSHGYVISDVVSLIDSSQSHYSHAKQYSSTLTLTQSIQNNVVYVIGIHDILILVSTDLRSHTLTETIITMLELSDTFSYNAEDFVSVNPFFYQRYIVGKPY